MKDTGDKFTFKTKTGICRITEEEITLERTGIRGNIALRAIGSYISKIRFIFVSCVILLILYKLNLFISKEYLYGYGSVVFLYSIYLILTSLKNTNSSATRIIKRSAIKKVESYKPIQLLKRGHFKITTNENSVEKNIIIILPGSLDKGSNEFKKALRIMKETGIIS